MRKWIIIVVIVAVALALLGFFVFSGMASGNRVSVYHYYPRINAYFDSSHSRFILRDSLGNWKTYGLLPPALRNAPGKKVRIVSKPDVWEQNAYHRLIYSVALYKTPLDLRESVRTRKPATQTASSASAKKDSTSADTPRKKGIEGFFDRLFKGRKDGEKRDSL